MERKFKYLKSYQIQSLLFLNQQKKIDFTPDYQRESVWTKSQKQLLIDSLFLELDIPKIYLREINREGFEYEVVDGQQRLRSIFEFLDNKFPLPNESDPVENVEIAGKYYFDLPTTQQMFFNNQTLDVVFLSKGYSDDDIDEMFLRLQNGTPLNAAEKRRAVNSKMVEVVKELATHKVYSFAGFTNKRFAYEDVSAKILHQFLLNYIADIKPASIKRTYEINKDLTSVNSTVNNVKKVFNFITSAFKGTANPKLKKYAFISLSFVIHNLLSEYTLGNYADEFGHAYLRFEQNRLYNESLPEEEQNPRLLAFADAARSDSLQDMEYRVEIYKEMILREIPQLELKDPTRTYSQEQRLLIFLKNDGKCANCEKKCDQDNFHADHIIPHSRGGKTSIENGQLLCPECNLKKSSNHANPA